MRNVVLPTFLVLAAACKSQGAPASDEASSASATAASAPSTPESPTAAAAVPPPSWMKGVSAKPVRAKVGDLVWAVIPSTSASDSDIGRLGVHKVDAINGTTASLSGKDGKHDVPGFFVLPVGDGTKLKAGDAVVAPYGGGWGFARVTKNDKGKLTVRMFLSDKTAKDVPVDVATAVPTGSTSAPFADVYYEKFPGSNYKGMVIAQDGGTSWVLDHDSSVLTETKAKLVSLKWAFKDRKVGDKVTIFAGMGATEGTITKVLEPKAFFDVQFGGSNMSATYDQLSDKL